MPVQEIADAGAAATRVFGPHSRPRRPWVHVLPVEKIDYVQAQDDYVSFRCEGKDYLKDQTLAQVEAALDPAKFVRIHRSYVLNVDRLARVELDSRENRIAILADGRQLPVSRAGYKRLSSLLCPERRAGRSTTMDNMDIRGYARRLRVTAQSEP